MVPAPVRHLLARCLERDPRPRLRDIGQARLLLEGAGFAPLGRSLAPPRRSVAVTLAPEDAIRYRLSADGATLHTERDVLDADIWLIEQGGDR